jgi:hypothetical protein
MAGLTWPDGHRLAVAPAGTQVVEGLEGGRQALVLPAGARLPEAPATGKPREPSLRVASHSGYGGPHVRAIKFLARGSIWRA